MEEGEPAGQEVTSEDMLQIKSFGTKEESCQATNTEQGYRGNQGDPKLDLRNGVTHVFHKHTCSHTCISLSPSLLLSRSTNKQAAGLPGKCITQRKCQHAAQPRNQAFLIK